MAATPPPDQPNQEPDHLDETFVPPAPQFPPADDLLSVTPAAAESAPLADHLGYEPAYEPPLFSPKVPDSAQAIDLLKDTVLPDQPAIDDDAVFLADEAGTGPDSGPTSGLFGKAEMMERVPLPEQLPPDASGFLPIPPSGLMTDILAEVGRLDLKPSSPPDEPAADAGFALTDTLVPPAPAADEEVPLGVPAQPTAPASGWLPSDRNLLKETKLSDTNLVNAAVQAAAAQAAAEAAAAEQAAPPAPKPNIRDTNRPPSAVDFKLPETDLVDQPSDIFSTAAPPRRSSGSDILGGQTGESELYAGATSDVLAHHPPSSGPGQSDVLSSAADDARGSSRFDVPERNTERVSFDLPPGLLATNPGEGGTGFDLSPEPVGASERTMAVPYDELDDSGPLLPGDANLSDSNVLDAGVDDGTAMDFEMLGADQGNSGVQLDSPDIEFDAGPKSSIFAAPSGSEPGAELGGRVDLGQIPLMGSSDEGTDLMVPPQESDRSLSVFQAAEAEQRLSDADSGLIEWGEPASDPNASPVQPTGRAAAVAATAAAAAGMSAGLPATSQRMARPTEPTPAVTTQRHPQPGTSTSGRAPAPVVPAGPPRTGRVLTGLAGLATGVLAGAGLTFGLMNQTGSPGVAANPGGSVAPQPAPVQPGTTAPPAAGGLAAGQALLAAGDPAAALAALEGATDDSVEVKAARGRARWMARARQAADAGRLPADDAELAKATADLQAAVQAAAGNNAPDVQKAGATAALHLGLVKEAAGLPDDAQKVYADAATQFPAFRKWFDSARRRVGVMMKDGNNLPLPKDRYSGLPAAEADRLAALGSLLLADFDPVQQPDDEAGFHFWEAVSAAANWQGKGAAFDTAKGHIDKARAAHDARRRRLVGMGLNPVSDPREQLFLRACDELKNYWEFKKRIYADPAGYQLASTKGTGGALAAMLDAVKGGGDGGPKLKDAEAKLAAAQKSLTELENLRKAADTAAAAEREAKKKAEAELAAAKKEADEQVRKLTADVTAAKKAADTAAADAKVAGDRLRAADAALDPVIAKLKAAKLIPEAATRAEAVAALPEAAKKAALVSGDAGGELAKQLAEAQKKLADAEAAAKLADDRAKAAMANADKSTKDALAAAEKKAADLQQQLKTADAKTADEVKKAVADARAELAAKLDAAVKAAAVEKDRAEAERQRAEVARADTAKLIEARLAAQAEEFRAQLAAVRAGATAEILEVERAAADRAGRGYEAGVVAYFAGRYADAEAVLTQAASDEPADARIVYFLGLAKFGQGKRDAAVADFRRGAALEARGRPGSRAVGAALERVQGPARAAVDAYRP